MDEISDHIIQDCFLRPISDVKTTNDHMAKSSPSKVTVKTEMQLLRLSDDSQKMTMETLRAIHGPDFQLSDASNYKDLGNRVKKTYWEDRGTLIVQSVQNFSKNAISSYPTDDESQLRRFAILKLESYGFAQSHCIEAYEHCNCDIEQALYLLYRKYMRIPDEISDTTENLSDEDLLSMREDEKIALESIYENAFEEKERNNIWCLKFKIDPLLLSSKAPPKTDVPVAAKTKAKNVCFNFDKNGKCKFGDKCRFAHIKKDPVIEQKSRNTDENDNENWINMEVRFPTNTKYPYEPPLILVTSSHGIRYELLLRISRRLYMEAKKICEEGVACVYSICELLQTENFLLELKNSDDAPFLDSEKSLFFKLDESTNQDRNILMPLPTHYTKGQTSRSDFKISSSQLERDNRKLMQRFMERQENKQYLDMMRLRQKLPAFAKMTEILSLIDNSQVVVISGETGCGKSTQVPQFILDNWLLHSSQLKSNEPMTQIEIICTQPRRLATIGVAERVAAERIERVGQTIGYQIRLENKISPSTRLTFCTTGILLRRLASEPLLDSVTHIIVDEVHERSEECDFLLMILKDILKHRKNLKVILMSATLNAKIFSDYFDGCAILDIPGRTFPVEQLFLEDVLEVCDYIMECDSQYCRKINKKEEQALMDELEYADVKSDNVAPPKSHKDESLTLAAFYARYNGYSKRTCKSIYLMDPMKINPELIESVLKYLTEGEHTWPKQGSILVFLPGYQEIQAVHEALLDSSIFGDRAGKYILLPLHSTLSSEEQVAIFKPAPKGKRKIILSTNIAETSVTIDDCVFVVDSGLMKEKSFDANRNMESLNLVWVSKANAMQRKGRAGRVMPGVCIHLFTGHRFQNHLLSQPVPEIHRVPLESLLLRVKTLPNLMNKNVIEVLGSTLEPPSEINIIAALTRLQDVGAIDEDQNLTPLGEHLSTLPVDVRIGKLMLYGAIFQCLDSVLTIAACLSHKSPFVAPFNKRAEAEQRKRSFAIANSDHLTSLMAYKKWLEVSKRNFFASRNYASENYLSLRTLETISEVKYQFLELLVSIGFVPIDVPRSRKNAADRILELTGNELNVNGDNNRLLLSLVYAALYPNIVKILSPEKTYIQTIGGAMPKMHNSKELRFKTRNDGYVAIHPSSVNADEAVFQSPFLFFLEKVKTSRIFIRECSMIRLCSLVLFAGCLKVELHDGDFVFVLEDNWIIVKAANHETAEIMKCLRTELFKLLEEKIHDPCLNLLNHANGKKIIKNIVYLISNNN